VVWFFAWRKWISRSEMFLTLNVGQKWTKYNHLTTYTKVQYKSQIHSRDGMFFCFLLDVSRIEESDEWTKWEALDWIVFSSTFLRKLITSKNIKYVLNRVHMYVFRLLHKELNILYNNRTQLKFDWILKFIHHLQLFISIQLL